jgi:hypothetical protein
MKNGLAEYSNKVGVSSRMTELGRSNDRKEVSCIEKLELMSLFEQELIPPLYANNVYCQSSRCSFMASA